MPQATPLDDAPDLCRLSAADLVQRYADRSLSPVEATRAALDRAGQVQARFNAFSHLDIAAALAAARESEARWQRGEPRGKLDGVPTTIKDIVWVRGWTVRYGSRAAPGVRAEEDAPAVALLREAGAVLLGLTTTPEFGWKALTDSALTGITRNPWNAARTSGGSSGGAAVAAACGAGVLHLGTDGGGSIRIPAAFCGVVGHKPTFGRVPAYPASPFGTVAHLGPITRSVADAALMLQVMSGRDLRDWYQSPWPLPPVTPLAPRDLRGLRIGVWDTPPRGEVAPDVRLAFIAVLDRLEQAGAVLAPVTLPGGDLWELFRLHWYSGAAARLRGVPAAAHDLVEAGLREVAAEGERLTAAELMQAQAARAAFGGAFERMLAAHDVLVSPAVALTAFAVGEEVPPGSGLGRWTEWAGFSYPVNLAQAPATVVPCGFGADGLPIGLQVVGRRGDDAGVLAAAAALQTAIAPS
ncbi:MAG TPA: amidase [Acetobacteraceae bacterium]|nr:amidase [Acetobacteraceae bacterium]